jgi:hypothetical protein
MCRSRFRAACCTKWLAARPKMDHIENIDVMRTSHIAGAGGCGTAFLARRMPAGRTPPRVAVDATRSSKDACPAHPATIYNSSNQVRWFLLLERQRAGVVSRMATASVQLPFSPRMATRAAAFRIFLAGRRPLATSEAKSPIHGSHRGPASFYMRSRVRWVSPCAMYVSAPIRAYSHSRAQVSPTDIATRSPALRAMPTVPPQMRPSA